jgi:hypothetical protein
MNLSHNLTLYFFKICFNVILQFTSRCSKLSTCFHISLLLITRLAHSLSHDYPRLVTNATCECPHYVTVPTPCVCLHFMCRYSLEYPVLKYLQCLLANVENETTFHTHTRHIDTLQFCVFQSLSLYTVSLDYK